MFNLHIISDGRYAVDFVRFIVDEFEELDKDYFFITGTGLQCMPKGWEANRWTYLSENYKFKLFKFVLLAMRCDQIILHGAFNETLVRILARVNLFAKKTKVVFWGGDLYVHEDVVKGVANKEMIDLEPYKAQLYRKCEAVVFDMDTDYELFHEWYHLDKRMYYATYPQTIGKDISESYARKQLEKRKFPIRILVGNSATKTNRHIETLDILRKFSKDPIEIYCPLSYGDMEYAKEVIDYGKRILGNKFIPVQEYMDENEYARLISSMDIAIFNQNRQQGMGNITLAGFLGVKIYISDETTMWERYVMKDSCKISAVKDIVSQSFEQFIAVSEGELSYNHKYYGRIFDMKEEKRMWRPVLMK